MASITSMRRETSGTITRIADYGGTITRLGGWALTASIAVIFLWFGSLKFIPFEAESLVGIIANNPLISWLYTVFGQPLGAARFLGVFEIATGLLILGRFVDPRLSALGGAMGVWAFLLTISSMFTTPGVIEKGWEGTLALSPGLGAFLVKDIVLVSACLWILGASLSEVRDGRRG